VCCSLYRLSSALGEAEGRGGGPPAAPPRGGRGVIRDILITVMREAFLASI